MQSAIESISGMVQVKGSR